MYDRRQKIWDRVYKKYQPSELPWYNLSFPQTIIRQLEKIDQKQLMIIPGCGIGETVKALWDIGFKNILGTDVSKISIDIAKNNFPKLQFKKIATEYLSYEGYRNANVFDWMNFHQIENEYIKDYLSSLQKISNNFILAYIFEPKLGKVRESYITGDKVYNHSPKMIIETVKKFNLTKKINFGFKINPKFGKKIHQAVGLIFQKTK